MKNRHADVLANQAWSSNEQWHHHDRQTIIPFILQGQMLEQSHSNYMGVKNESFSQRVSLLGEYECEHWNIYSNVPHA